MTMAEVVVMWSEELNNAECSTGRQCFTLHCQLLRYTPQQSLHNLISGDKKYTSTSKFIVYTFETTAKFWKSWATFRSAELILSRTNLNSLCNLAILGVAVVSSNARKGCCWETLSFFPNQRHQRNFSNTEAFMQARESKSRFFQ